MPVKAFFGLFSVFFTDGRVAFTHTFLELFTGSPKFSRTLFRIFSRMGFFFHGKEMSNFRKFSRMAFFFTDGFFFLTGAKIYNIARVFFFTFRICSILEDLKFQILSMIKGSKLRSIMYFRDLLQSLKRRNFIFYLTHNKLGVVYLN